MQDFPEGWRWYRTRAHWLTHAEYMARGVVGPDHGFAHNVPVSLPAGTLAFPLIPGYLVRASKNWELITQEGSDKPVAVYTACFSVRVLPEHQRRGLATAMVVWRAEHRGVRDHVAVRTQAMHDATSKAHRELVRRALERGDYVSTQVLQDYPELGATW